MGPCMMHDGVVMWVVVVVGGFPISRGSLYSRTFTICPCVIAEGRMID